MKTPIRFLSLIALVLTSSQVFAEDQSTATAGGESARFEEQISDPLETFNRGVYVFNDRVDWYVLGPVSRGYDQVLPDTVQAKVTNFFENLRYPVYLLSDVAQFKFTQAANHTGRFLINSTLGLAGLFDVAEEFGLEEHDEDFGVALAYHGVPPGPFLMLPLVGPTTVRDGVGRIVDTIIHPFMLIDWAFGVRAGITDRISWSGYGVNAVNTRASLDDAIRTTRESSTDPYTFTQSAYYQYRLGLLNDGVTAEDDEEFLEE